MSRVRVRDDARANRSGGVSAARKARRELRRPWRGFAARTRLGCGDCRRQELSSVTDATLIEICRAEDRAIVSFDKDFADVVHFPPVRYRGIVVLRLPEPVTLPMILNALTRVADLAETRSVVGRLWIVSINRIREYGPPP